MIDSRHPVGRGRSVPISLDTYKAETAERAFEYGIEIVNDPSGLTFDADLAKRPRNRARRPGVGRVPV